MFLRMKTIVEDVSYEAPLGKSDHVVVTWNLIAEPEARSLSCDSKYDYWRGDYAGMTSELQTVDWERALLNKDANEMWLLIVDGIILPVQFWWCSNVQLSQ